MAAEDEPRRAPAADQRVERRHVARRAPALPAVRDRAFSATPVRAFPRPLGHHRPLAGRRAGPVDLRRGARHGRRLRSGLVARPRSATALPDASRADQTARDGMIRPLDRWVSGEEEPVRVAVVGLGYWGPNLVRNL